MSQHNYARRMGTLIKDPRVLFTQARINGKPVGEGDFPMGDFSVEPDAVDYMVGRVMGRVWWMKENPGAEVQVDVSIVETGETKTIIREPNGSWKEVTDAEPRTTEPPDEGHGWTDLNGDTHE
jgi:hypothetical protein